MSLYREYVALHDHFGRGGNDVMKCSGTSAPGEGGRSRREGDRCDSRRCRRSWYELHLELPRHGLVVWTGGNVSVRDPETGLVAIKPSGVRYEDLTADSMVVLDIDGRVVEGAFHPSSDTASHLYIYRHRPDVNGVVHTHSRYATAFAAVGTADPGLPDRPRRRVRRRDPVRRVCPASAARRSAQQVVERDRQLAGDPAQEPRRVHGRPDRRPRSRPRSWSRTWPHTVWLALQIGNPEVLPDDIVDRLHDRYATSYGQ